MKDQFESYFKSLQDEITGIIEMVEGKAKFVNHSYDTGPRENGIVKIIKNGQALQKGSVNRYFLQSERDDYIDYKTGLKIVFHPKNPNAPIVQTHYQYHEISDLLGAVTEESISGEMNLIPNYLIREDASYFHRVCQEVCNKYHPDWYTSFKKQCDKHYWNPLRKETLGIGGIYFEDLKADDQLNVGKLFRFIKDLGEAFIPSYMPILEKRKDAPAVENHRNWQAFRRGRFIEYDFLFDSSFPNRTKESIHPDAVLAQLPPESDFKYGFEPEEGSREAMLVNALKNPREWV